MEEPLKYLLGSRFIERHPYDLGIWAKVSPKIETLNRLEDNVHK